MFNGFNYYSWYCVKANQLSTPTFYYIHECQDSLIQCSTSRFFCVNYNFFVKNNINGSTYIGTVHHCFIADDWFIVHHCYIVQDCLRLFEVEEKLEGSSQWKCTQCKSYQDAVKKMEIWKLPPILLIALKRYSTGQRVISLKCLGVQQLCHK